MRTKIKNEYINISKEEIKKVLLLTSDLSGLAEIFYKQTKLSSFSEEEKKVFKNLYPELFL